MSLKSISDADTPNESVMLYTITQRLIILFIILVADARLAIAQVNEQNIRNYLDNARLAPQVHSISRLKEFYSLRAYQPVWRHKEIAQLLAYLDQCESLGLNRNDYKCAQIDSLFIPGWKPKTNVDSLLFEIRVTDVALHLFLDVATGAGAPYFGYNGLNWNPDQSALLRIIDHSFEEDAFNSLIPQIEPTCAEYQSVKLLLNQLQDEMNVPAFHDVVVTSNRVDLTNRALLSRLKQLTIVDSTTAIVSVKDLIQKIKTAQRMFKLLADGILRSTTITEINVPLEHRVDELKRTLNAVRWLASTPAYQSAVIVNIPSASLLVYQNGKVVLESKVIVGKRSTPTPMLCSTISEVILYPYWMVPKKIATRELLPIIKQDIGYLDDNGFQVLNLQGKIVNPYHINWKELNESNFPYVLRQSTGCDNSLGLVKLNFYSPFSVYLHDTPWKNLFSFNKRYFSHGCVRVERAIELGRLLLKNNEEAIDTVTEKGCLKNQAPITVAATNRLPVFVLYQTAWVDSTARVSFEEDIYQKLRRPSIPNKFTKKPLTKNNDSWPSQSSMTVMAIRNYLPMLLVTKMY